MPAGAGQVARLPPLRRAVPDCAGARTPVIGFLRPIRPDFPLYSDTPILFFPANPSPVAALVAEARGNRVRGLDGADFDEKTRLEKNHISTTFFLEGLPYHHKLLLA